MGGAIATGLGDFTEIEISSTASLVVFLALFFSNFVASRIAVILVMDGSLEDAQGRPRSKSREPPEEACRSDSGVASSRRKLLWSSRMRCGWDRPA